MSTPLIEPIDSSLYTPGNIVSVELFTQLATNLNLFMDSVPAGSIMAAFDDLPGCPAIDTTVWELCDGSIVANPSSPLFGVAKPNMTQTDAGFRCMIKARSTPSPTNLGANSVTLNHNHSGLSGNKGTITNINAGGAPFPAIPHAHEIFGDLSPTNLVPINITMNFYFKVI